MLSFYDWYADLPVASPQVFGDQTDVPESADWWNAGYLIMWGSNVPVTRTPDAHFMTEARYRGQKVVVVSPDYADNTKFADEWLAPHPGTDGALAMAMGHVILKEFFVDRQVPRFGDYVKKYTDLPFLITPAASADGAWRRPTSSSPPPTSATRPRAPTWKTVLLDSATGAPARAQRVARLPLQRAGDGQVEPRPRGHRPRALAARRHGDRDRRDPDLPRFDIGQADTRAAASHAPRRPRRATHVERRAARHDRVRPAARAVRRRPRRACPASGPPATTTPSRTRPPGRRRSPACPPPRSCASPASSPQNAEDTGGRSMIIMGAGTNHWFHSDQIYRAMLALTTLTGCQGVNGGGWAHYVGQEKVRPITGWAQLAFGLDWVAPAAADDRHRVLVPRRPTSGATTASAPTSSPRRWARAGSRASRMIDTLAQSARFGWMPSYPTFDRNPLDLADEAEAAGQAPAAYVVEQLQERRPALRRRGPRRAGELPARAHRVAGEPARLLEQGQRVLPAPPARHRATPSAPRRRPRASARSDVVWRDEAPEGKLDLLVTHRLPHDEHRALRRRPAPGGHLVREARPLHHRHAPVRARLQPGDRPAVGDPQRLRHLPGPRPRPSRSSRPSTSASARTSSPCRCCTTPRTRWPQPGGVVRDWKTGECEPIPGVTMPEARRRRARLRDRREQDVRPRAATASARHAHARASRFSPVEEVEMLASKQRRRSRTGSPRAVRPRDGRCTPARRSSRSRARRTAASRCRASGRWRSAPGMPLADLATEQRGQAHHLRRHPGATGARHHRARVVRQRARRPALLAVHASTSSGSSPGTP